MEKPVVEMRVAQIIGNRLRGKISKHHKIKFSAHDAIAGMFVTTGVIIGKDGDLFETKNTIYHITDWVKR